MSLGQKRHRKKGHKVDHELAQHGRARLHLKKSRGWPHGGQLSERLRAACTIEEGGDEQPQEGHLEIPLLDSLEVQRRQHER